MSKSPRKDSFEVRRNNKCPNDDGRPGHNNEHPNNVPRPLSSVRGPSVVNLSYDGYELHPNSRGDLVPTPYKDLGDILDFTPDIPLPPLDEVAPPPKHPTTPKERAAADFSHPVDVNYVADSRHEAVAKGFAYYFTGNPCSYGHLSLRYAVSSGCAACARIRGGESRSRAQNANYAGPSPEYLQMLDSKTEKRTQANGLTRNEQFKMKIISRQEAKDQGLNKFYTGVVCVNGHYAERYVNNGVCCACVSTRMKRHHQTVKQKTSDQKDRDAAIAKARKEAAKEAIKARKAEAKAAILQRALAEQAEIDGYGGPASSSSSGYDEEEVLF